MTGFEISAIVFVIGIIIGAVGMAYIERRIAASPSLSSDVAMLKADLAAVKAMLATATPAPPAPKA